MKFELLLMSVMCLRGLNLKTPKDTATYMTIFQLYSILGDNPGLAHPLFSAPMIVWGSIGLRTWTYLVCERLRYKSEQTIRLLKQFFKCYDTTLCRPFNVQSKTDGSQLGVMSHDNIDLLLVQSLHAQCR